MDELGEDFDIKEFHRVVLLHNRLPLPLLERLVDDYIESKGPACSVATAARREKGIRPTAVAGANPGWRHITGPSRLQGVTPRHQSLH